jgi:hypothetical protein
MRYEEKAGHDAQEVEAKALIRTPGLADHGDLLVMGLFVWGA